MSYAILATLTAEYGLYSSFIGVFIYCFFATSKDVTIGVRDFANIFRANTRNALQLADPEKTFPMNRICAAAQSINGTSTALR